EGAGEVEDAAPTPQPVLMPLLVGRRIRVDAPPVAAACTGPVLLQAAAALDALDAVVAGACAVRRDDVPVADPEIELAVLTSAARRLLRRGSGALRNRSA